MTNRERTRAILHYEAVDRMPVVHFGYWPETLEKWAEEGHITKEQATNWADGNAADNEIARRIGFDFNWSAELSSGAGMNPLFEPKVLERHEDGSYLERDCLGVTVLKKPGAVSIPMEIEHSLKDRASWEADFKHRFQYFPGRTISKDQIPDIQDRPRGLYLGSLFGALRDTIGLVNISYLYADDEDLYREMIDTNAQLTYDCAKAILEQGLTFDYAHFWEDICFKNGPLVSPTVFEECVAPHYRRITDLCRSYGIDIVSLDCDGCIDTLVPIWLENGVNTMFPIEVGTWGGSIQLWRQKYGKELRGVGGMDKRVFACDYAAVDKEIERLKPLIALGGYIPCPDHRIAPDARFENVQYYCEKMHNSL